MTQVSNTLLTLLDEYGLTSYHLDILRLCVHPTYWKEGLDHSITSLYRLIDKGLLTGPQRGKPHDTPFELTKQGKWTLYALERGLHAPAWFSKHKINALKAMTENGTGVIEHDLNAHRLGGFTLGTLKSLERAGYVEKLDATWRITDLGIEAYANFLQEKAP